MGLTILKKKSGYVLGLILCIIGVIMLLIVVWKTWQHGVFSSSDPLSDFYVLLLETPDVIFGIDLIPLYYTIVGFVLLIVGGVILVVRREKVRVVEEVTALLECPLCKNEWREPIAEAQLKSMGYPEVRTLTRRRCANCGKFIRPKIVKTEK